MSYPQQAPSPLLPPPASILLHLHTVLTKMNSAVSGWVHDCAYTIVWSPAAQSELHIQQQCPEEGSCNTSEPLMFRSSVECQFAFEAVYPTPCARDLYHCKAHVFSKSRRLVLCCTELKNLKPDIRQKSKARFRSWISQSEASKRSQEFC